MSRLYVYCEGPSEREFVDRVLSPYLKNYGIISSSIPAKHQGGKSSFKKIEDELLRICHDHKNEFVTTMFDYYGLPKDAPGMDSGNILDVECCIAERINASNLIVYLSKHEFEALLFSDVRCFKDFYPDAVNELEKIRRKYPTPEEINNSVNTAPSKRILHFIPEYRKTIDGTNVAMSIGMDKMISECPHFKKWIESIINKCGQ